MTEFAPIWAQLKDLRRRADISLDEMAKRAHYRGASSIQRYESPDYKGDHLDIKVVQRLEKALVGLGNPPITRAEVFRLAGPLGEAAAEKYPAAEPVPPSRREDQTAFAFEPVPVPHPVDVKGYLPVLGSARGGNGEEGAFDLNGTVVDQVKRPPALANVQGAYGLYVQGTSMEPRYFEGELVYVHPHRPVRAGDFAVIQFKQRHDGDHVRALIKRVVVKAPGLLKVEQYNPAKVYDIPMGEVASVHRILNGDELW